MQAIYELRGFRFRKLNLKTSPLLILHLQLTVDLPDQIGDQFNPNEELFSTSK